MNFDGFDIDNFLSGIREKKVLIVGDVMIDTYLWGKVDRVSPEAPVPIVSDIIEESRLGGAANVALNVKSLGAVPILCSVIGGDEKGNLFLSMLEEQNLADIGITVDDYRLTTQKTRVISGYKHLLRIDEEMGSELSRRLEKDFIQKCQNLVGTGNIDAIIFQDYDKGVITPLLIKKLTESAKTQNIPVMVDPKFRNFHNYKQSTLFKPNLKEFLKGALRQAQEPVDIKDIMKAGEKYRKEQAHDILTITLSDKGILVLSDDGAKQIEAIKRDITDVSGAGDTVISVAAICLAGGMNPEQIAAVSNIAGGQVCEKSGVVPVNLERLIEECREAL